MTSRDYNVELNDGKNLVSEKYAYGFDFDVMHPYMIKSFRPFFRPGSLLELGSYKGNFSRRLAEHFSDITCVEASNEALQEARALRPDFYYVNDVFETVGLPRRFDNIVMTHVLEHLDDPVAVLRRVNDEWLADGGRFFLVCPNANAPSRQIAVKMGLIPEVAWRGESLAPKDHPVSVTRVERYELDKRFRERVTKILSKAQREEIVDEREGYVSTRDHLPWGL